MQRRLDATWRNCADARSLTEISLDTSVVRALVRGRTSDPDYLPLTDGATLTLSYFVDAELATRRWSRDDQSRYDALMTRCVALANPRAITKYWFVQAWRKRRELGFSRSERNHTDLWIIAQTAEYELGLVSHDKQMIRIADALGLEYQTLLPDIGEQLERDRERLGTRIDG